MEENGGLASFTITDTPRQNLDDNSQRISGIGIG